MKLRVSGICSSIQEEGYTVGKPSIFIKTFGCNFKCNQYGVFHQLLDGKNKEIESIINKLYFYNSIEELPKLKTGCDSYYSVYSEFRKFTKDYSVEELIDVIISLQPEEDFAQYDLVFTGGEPLLYQSFFNLFLNSLSSFNQKRIIFETNGTLYLNSSLIDCMNNTQIQFIWSVSPKLANTGHIFFDTFIPEALRSYNKVNHSILVLKFVISKSTFNYNELFQFIKGYSENGIEVEDIFLVPEGSILDQRFEENKQFTLSLCNKYGFRFSHRQIKS